MPCCALQVRQLEHEKGVTTLQFERRENELSHLLGCSRDDFDSMRRERDELRERCEAAEGRTAQLEADHGGLSAQLASERGTTMSALTQYQRREKEQVERIDQVGAGHPGGAEAKGEGAGAGDRAGRHDRMRILLAHQDHRSRLSRPSRSSSHPDHPNHPDQAIKARQLYPSLSWRARCCG